MFLLGTYIITYNDILINIVYPQHLKHGTEKLFKVLAILFNASKNLGYFIDKWKISKITMILKPEKTASLPGSYRPISLLPVLGKLMEKIMTNRIAHCNKFQTGFQKGKSTTHQILRLVEHITKWYN